MIKLFSSTDNLFSSNGDEFHMKKSVIEEEIAKMCNEKGITKDQLASMLEMMRGRH